MRFRFGTYNLFNLGQLTTHEERDRYDLLVQVIRGLDTDVLAVQEIIGSDPAEAATVLRRLADDTGMSCEASRAPGVAPEAAMASSQHRFHVGLLWRPGVEPVPGSLWTCGGGVDFWHAMTTVVFDIGAGRFIKFGSYHADPFRPSQRLSEAYRVLSAFQDGSIPGGVGADWNEIGADRRPTGAYFDPDTLPGQTHRKVRYQARFDPADPAAPAVSDRSATTLLLQQPGGLVDTAAVADVPWLPTTGHWLTGGQRAESFGPRRIDTLRVTADLAPAVRAHTTHGGPITTKLAGVVFQHLADGHGSIAAKAAAVLSRHLATGAQSAAERASDHMPVTTDLDLTTMK
ncbi:hypothetical protein OHV05_15020 [Kitasatospora sp. NBC_00070]|uniref:hypothetical protein n=1 Tax=Kitasatospora sp. NBC_00070 TaxID=2975962 RepID=UPI00324E8F73